jgi:stress response protein YsnF
MLTDRELSDAVGSTAFGADGEPLGTVGHFLADDRTGTPTWVAVRPDPSVPRLVVVPVAGARFVGGGLHVPVRRELVDRAPAIATAEHLEPAEERLLRRYYGLDGAGAPAPADGAMTRSEEQLRVRTERVAATRVRLVKYVVTEEVQVTVPVRREEVRLEEVPLDAPEPGPAEFLAPGGRPADGPEGTGGDLPDEIVLHREEPVIGVRVVPAERVRLRTDVVEEQTRISGRVQRERIVLDEEPPARSGG